MLARWTRAGKDCTESVCNILALRIGEGPIDFKGEVGGEEISISGGLLCGVNSQSVWTANEDDEGEDLSLLVARGTSPLRSFGGPRLEPVLVISLSLHLADISPSPREYEGLKKRLNRLGVIGGGFFGFVLVILDRGPSGEEGRGMVSCERDSFS